MEKKIGAIGAIALISLILGAAGLGLIYITTQSTELSPIEIMYIYEKINQSSTGKIWTNVDYSKIYSTPTVTWKNHTGLIISFEVQQGESVYLSFNCEFYLQGDGGGQKYLYIRFDIDGVITTTPEGTVSDNPGSGYVYGSFTLQDFPVLSHGSHNVTISIYGNYALNYIDDCSLLVQTFIP